MEMDFFEGIVFRLRPGAVDCDGEGLRIAGYDLLSRRTDAASRPTYGLAPIEALEERLWRAYGYKVSAAGKLRGLQVVADALSKGEIARAQIAALLLRLPDPDAALGSAPALAKRLHDCGWLLKSWEPDKHPRTGTPPNPGWFSPTDGGADAQTGTPRGATSAPNSETKPSTTTAHGGGEQEVAVLTTNFRYACRALRLDPYVASDILHRLKEDSNVGPADNCTFDTESGDVYFNGEYIGNLRE